MDKVVVARIAQSVRLGALQQLLPPGLLVPDGVDAELGEVRIGSKPARTPASGSCATSPASACSTSRTRRGGDSVPGLRAPSDATAPTRPRKACLESTPSILLQVRSNVRRCRAPFLARPDRSTAASLPPAPDSTSSMQRVLRRALTLVASTFAFSSLACSLGTEPQDLAHVTLLVVNDTCLEGECVPISVRGRVPKYSVPGQPKVGFLRIGTVETASACLVFPQVDSLTVSGPDHTTVTRWTPADRVSLRAFDARDIARYTPWSVPIIDTTRYFVPADARGWRVRFPSGVGAALLEPAERCDP